MNHLEKKQYRFNFWIAIVVITSLALIITLTILFYNVNENSWGRDAYKLCIQFLLIVVVGGFVSLLFKRLGELRDSRSKNESDEREFAQLLIKAYNKIKFIRRMIRGDARVFVKETAFIKRKLYIKYMGDLNDAQLQFEYAARILPMNKLLFEAHRNEIRKSISEIERALNQINKEFEKVSPNQDQSEKEFQLEEAPRLMGFIESSKNDFFKEFQKLNSLLKLGLNIEE